MEKFYIYKDDQQLGPFSIDELKEQGLKHETMLWYPGAPKWQRADEIDELKVYIKEIPPPFSTSGQEVRQIVKGSSGSDNFFVQLISQPVRLSLFVPILILVCSLTTYYASQLQTKYDGVIRQIELQRARIIKQENIEVERSQAQRRLEQQQRQQKLQEELDLAITQLRQARIDLDEIKKFQFLRTESEKSEQVSAQLHLIRELEREVDSLRKIEY